MKPISIDTETALIQDGQIAPPMTCLTWSAGGVTDIIHVSEVRPFLEYILSDPETLIVAHNSAFDMAVIGTEFPDLMPAVFAAYDADRVTDTKLRQQLIDLANGNFRKFGYSLADCARRHLGVQLNKGPDSWRLRYGELRPVPLAWWPKEALEYALSDAKSTLEVYEKQEAESRYLVDQFRQARSAFALHFVSSWGMRTDVARVRELEARTRAEVEQLEGRLIQAGLVRPDGTRDTKKAKARILSIVDSEPKLTATGQVCLDAEACEDSGDDLLKAYARRTALQTILDKDVPHLSKGYVYSRFEPLMETGRTSSTGFNLQNPRREGGVRECFIPRDGFVFAVADYDGLELRTVAQVCLRLLGKSALAEVLNSGQDPHLALGAELLGIDYASAKARIKSGDASVKEARQFGKVGNFGFPGGLGIKRFRAHAKRMYGLDMTETQALRIKQAWFARYPEFREYFARIGAAVEYYGQIEQLFSERVRDVRDGFTEGCNGMFQGLGADATKAALYRLVRECVVGTGVLSGSRVVNFVHDEKVLEVPEDVGHECAQELQRIMVTEANKWLPDVPATTTPLLSRCWSKDAKPVYDDSGRLVPWDLAL